MQLTDDIRLKRNTMCIDPGENTGIAFLDKGSILRVDFIEYKSNDSSLENYINYMCSRMKYYLLRHRPRRILIEQPKYWDSDKGNASLRSGSLTHLMANVFSYAGLFSSMGLNFYFVDVNKWKGNLTKEATLYRVGKIIGKKFIDKYGKNDHIIDAVGILLSIEKQIWQLKKKANFKYV